MINYFRNKNPTYEEAESFSNSKLTPGLPPGKSFKFFFSEFFFE